MAQGESTELQVGCPDGRLLHAKTLVVGYLSFKNSVHPDVFK
jgi:hypothetical protein